MKRRLLLSLLSSLLLAGGTAQGIGIKLRPQGDALTRAVQAALAELSTRDVPMTLDTSSGPTLTLGGVGASAAPFNPDESGRVVQVAGERRLEFNPQGPVPLLQAVRELLRDELKLKDWSPAAAQLRFGGADLNGDGVVDLGDLATLMDNYGKANPSQGDLNQDRKVNDADVQIFMALYRTAFAYQDPLGPVPVEAVPVTPAAANPAKTNPATPSSTTPGATVPGATIPSTTVPGTTATPATSPAVTPASPATTPSTTTPANPAPTNPAPTNPTTPNPTTPTKP